MTTKEAINKAFDSYSVGDRFRGWEFKQRVSDFRPEVRTMYVDTILRQLRKFYHGRYRVIGSYDQSLYEKIS